MRAALVILALGLISSDPLARAQAASADEAKADEVFNQLLTAQLHDDYDSFVADGTVQLKAALTKTQFDASSSLLAPKLKAGYDLQSLGELNQRGYEVYLYKLHLTGGGDDILATMSLKDGQVAGIYFK